MSILCIVREELASRGDVYDSLALSTREPLMPRVLTIFSLFFTAMLSGAAIAQTAMPGAAGGMSSFWWIILIIVLVVVIWYFMRRRRL